MSKYSTRQDLWPDADLLRLRELWDKGLSTAEIGRQIGRTKNAVIGQAHRLELPSRASPIKGAQPKPPPAPKPLKPAQDVATMQRLAAKGFSGLAIAKVVGCDPKTVRKNVHIIPVHERAPAPSVISPPIVRPTMAAIEAVQQIRLSLPAPVSSPRKCQWIDGDVRVKGWEFCNHPVVGFTSWCEEHRRRVFQPFGRREAA